MGQFDYSFKVLVVISQNSKVTMLQTMLQIRKFLNDPSILNAQCIDGSFVTEKRVALDLGNFNTL